MKKTKRFVRARNVDSERSGRGSSGIQSKDDRDLSSDSFVEDLIRRRVVSLRVFMIHNRT